MDRHRHRRQPRTRLPRDRPRRPRAWQQRQAARPRGVRPADGPRRRAPDGSPGPRPRASGRLLDGRLHPRQARDDSRGPVPDPDDGRIDRPLQVHAGRGRTDRARGGREGARVREPQPDGAAGRRRPAAADRGGVPGARKACMADPNQDRFALAALHRGFKDLAVTAEQVRAIRVPTVAIVGSLDGYLPDFKEMQALRPGMRLVVIDGASHGGPRGRWLGRSSWRRCANCSRRTRRRGFAERRRRATCRRLE